MLLRYTAKATWTIRDSETHGVKNLIAYCGDLAVEG